VAAGSAAPDNILVDDHGTVTLIDFGATQVAGLQERAPDPGPHWPRGAALYSAPESFLGQPASAASDQFSLAVIAYQMLTGQLPYGAEIPKTRSLSQQRRLRPRPLAVDRPDLPGWLEPALKRALVIEPHRRYPALSEFLFDLSRPRPDWQQRHRPPWMTRHPVAFWQGISALLLLALLATWAGRV
jgi:serine/threonine protein kinase